MNETLEGRKTGGTDGEVRTAGGRGGKGGTRGGNRGGCREDKARQLRLMKLLEQVQRGGYPNATDLRKKFEVSRSTIMRDIDFLKDQYLVPIEYCSERGGDQENRLSEPLRYIDEEELAELEEGRRWEELPRGPEPAAPNYFDRLMTPGSEESAWHNAALDEGHDPEDW